MGLFKRLFIKESAAERNQWIEGAVQAVGQRAAAQQIQTARRSFEAAETPAWTESWPTQASPINEDLSRQLPIMRARSRGIARNNEWATSFGHGALKSRQAKQVQLS